VNAVHGFNLLFPPRYDEAIRQLRTAVAVDPGYFWSHEYLGRALAQIWFGVDSDLDVLRSDASSRPCSRKAGCSPEPTGAASRDRSSVR
jgi:hypothetical protein